MKILVFSNEYIISKAHQLVLFRNILKPVREWLP